MGVKKSWLEIRGTLWGLKKSGRLREKAATKEIAPQDKRK